jgi:hypothetical protein
MAPANLDETKVKVLGVLESTDLHTERANKLTQTDFLVLLNAFNQNGFHFKS